MTYRTLTHTNAQLKHNHCALTPCAPHTTPLYGVWGVVCAVSVEGGHIKRCAH